MRGWDINAPCCSSILLSGCAKYVWLWVRQHCTSCYQPAGTLLRRDAGRRKDDTWMTASWLWRCCSRSCRRRSRSLSCLLSASSSILSASASSAAAAISPAALLSVPDVLLQGDLDGGLVTGLPDLGHLCLESCIPATCSSSHGNHATASVHPCPHGTWPKCRYMKRMGAVDHKPSLAHGLVWVCTTGRPDALDEALMLSRTCLRDIVLIDTSYM